MDLEEALGWLENTAGVFIGAASEHAVRQKLNEKGNQALDQLVAATRTFLKSDQLPQDLAALEQAFAPCYETPAGELCEALTEKRRGEPAGNREGKKPSPDAFDGFIKAMRDLKIATTIALHPGVRGVQQLAFLRECFESGEAIALVKAYEKNHVTGTRGTAFMRKDKSEKHLKPAVINEQGVLEPAKFEEYMETLRWQVSAALNGTAEMELQGGGASALNVPFVYATLDQMVESVSFGTLRDPDSGYLLSQLFKTGKQMALMLETYARANGQSIADVENLESKLSR